MKNFFNKIFDALLKAEPVINLLWVIVVSIVIFSNQHYIEKLENKVSDLGAKIQILSNKSTKK